MGIHDNATDLKQLHGLRAKRCWQVFELGAIQSPHGHGCEATGCDHARGFAAHKLVGMRVQFILSRMNMLFARLVAGREQIGGARMINALSQGKCSFQRRRAIVDLYGPKRLPVMGADLPVLLARGLRARGRFRTCVRPQQPPVHCVGQGFRCSIVACGYLAALQLGLARPWSKRLEWRSFNVIHDVTGGLNGETSKGAQAGLGRLGSRAFAWVRCAPYWHVNAGMCNLSKQQPAPVGISGTPDGTRTRIVQI